jgi:hypothetical protein
VTGRKPRGRQYKGTATPELIRDAIELAKQGQSRTEIALALGIPAARLETWVSDLPGLGELLREAKAGRLTSGDDEDELPQAFPPFANWPPPVDPRGSGRFRKGTGTNEL